MDEFELRIEELFLDGYHCSQIMLMLSLEMRGEENPELIRALGGLGVGMFCERTCGTLTGACCLIGSFGAKGAAGDVPALPYRQMCRSLVEWFEREFGSIECREIVGSDRASIMQKCPALLAATFSRCLEMLEDQGVDAFS